MNPGYLNLLAAMYRDEPETLAKIDKLKSK